MDTTRPSLLYRLADRSDANAWRTFDAIYRPMLRRFARRWGLGEEDVEDVVQHCMVAVLDHISDFRYDPARGRFKGWLRTLVNNRIRDLLRDRHEWPAGTGYLSAQPDGGPSPDEAFEQIWMEEHLAHCLREISGEVEERTFQAFWQLVMEQKSVEEVSAALGLQPNNLYTIKWRLTERVAARMKELVDGLD
ncbi:MAG TPA: sigma-70 family RNA polymerase sigma factor [Phycisphaerae bacterium]|nr:sigma-70 family RNA polymerase sigma factor [Phycisphaerae bacterium]